MLLKKIVPYLFVCFAFAPFYGSAQTWDAPVQVVSPFTTGGNAGVFAQLLLVDGYPAMAYYDQTRGNLVFVRASNASGTSFGTPVTLDSNLNVGQNISLQIVNGNPAIAYFDNTNGDLKYIRANDASGTAWGTALTLDGAAAVVGQYNSLQVVNGNPAIAYYDQTNTDLKYIRATDATGSAWGAASVVDGASSSVGLYASMQIVNGNPAIAYYDGTNQDLKYISATDASGTVWGTAATLAGAGIVAGTFSSLQIINGNPAVAYYEAENLDLKFIRATDIAGTAWAVPVTVDGAGTAVGQHASLQTINGNPAIAYYDAGGGNLKYARATDAAGTTWAAALMLDGASTSVGQYGSLQEINGKPAIAYYAAITNDLKFISATDATGTAWAAPLSFDVTGNVGLYTSMQIVDGNPAMSYYDQSNGDLKYTRAIDAAGTTWDAPVTVDGATSNVGQYSSMQIVNGNPAIVYYDLTNGDLKYVSATDVAGTSWGVPVMIDGIGNVGEYASLQVVNGNPAIAYYDATNQDLKYSRATDAAGTTWAAGLTVDGASAVGQYASLQIVNGNPAIAYYDQTSADLKYIRATDATGTVWGPALTVEGGASNVGQYSSLQMVNGSPAIAYYDTNNGNLKFVRSADATGTAWGAALTIDPAANVVGQHASLQVVNGKPAVAYYEAISLDLKYISATDASGTAWGTGVILDATGGKGTYNAMISGVSGAMIAYYSTTQALPYFIKTTAFIVLPVTLSHIKAYGKNSGVQVEWTAQQENRLHSYEVERSASGQQFDKMGTLAATGTSTAVYNYSFFDASPLNGDNFYRIKFIDRDGKFTYSQVLKVNVKSTGAHIVNIYPNPVQANNIALQLNLPKGKYVISLSNAAGRQITTRSMLHTGGASTQNIEPETTLAAGIYQLTIKGEGIHITRQLIKK